MLGIAEAYEPYCEEQWQQSMLDTWKKDSLSYRQELARRTLNNMSKDADFMASGRRNDDTVNFLICLEIIRGDVQDLETETIIDILIEQMGMRPTMRVQVARHIDRIKPYVEGWCEPRYRYGYDFILPDGKNIVWDIKDNCVIREEQN